MTTLERHVGELARASKKTALISAVGALIVLAAFAVGSYWMLETLGELDAKATALKGEIAEKQALKASLDKELAGEKQEVHKLENVKRELEQKIRLTSAEKDAAVAELQQLNGELVAASTPKACQELQTAARAGLLPEAPQLEVAREVAALVPELPVGLVGALLCGGRPLAGILEAERRRDDQHLAQRALVAATEDHPPQPRIDGQPAQLLADRRQPPVASDRSDLPGILGMAASKFFVTVCASLSWA